MPELLTLLPLLRSSVWYFIAFVPACFAAMILVGVAGEVGRVIPFDGLLWLGWVVPLAVGAGTYAGLVRWLRRHGRFTPTLPAHIVRAGPLYIALALLTAYMATVWTYRDLSFVVPLIAMCGAVAIGGIAADAIATLRHRRSHPNAQAA